MERTTDVGSKAEPLTGQFCRVGANTGIKILHYS